MNILGFIVVMTMMYGLYRVLVLMITHTFDDRQKVLEEVVEVLETGYHPQNPSSMHPADYITKKFKLDGHENLEYR